jgi:ATP-dependent Clp protease adaptor protein ClpS
MTTANTHTQTDTRIADEILEKVLETRNLIVWNDNVNSFDNVIKALVEICDHTPEQAEQCAMIIHTKGKYTVKTGSYDELKPLREAITDRGINATID